MANKDPELKQQLQDLQLQQQQKLMERRKKKELANNKKKEEEGLSSKFGVTDDLGLQVSFQ